MPFKPQVPILQVESAAIHTVDPRSAEQLFGLWSIFSKCSETMEDGKRLENLSWRLWNRETFCCAPEQKPLFGTPRWSFTRNTSESGSFSVPALSSSVDSDDSSDDQVDSTTLNTPASSRPEIRRQDSTDSRNRGTEKHLTSVDLESLVISIKQKKDLEPLSPLPMPPPSDRKSSCEDVEHEEEAPAPPTVPAPHHNMVPESSTSTVATAMDSDFSKASPIVESDTSTTTENSTHSVIRGFSPGRVVSSYRSRTNLHNDAHHASAAPTPILKSSQPHYFRTEPKKKGAMFTLGGSSDEDGNSSLETHMQMNTMRSSLSDGLRRPDMGRKQTSFKDEIQTRILNDPKAYESEEVFESDSDEEEVSESAIEEDDDDQWEDSEDESGPSSVNDRVTFQRVDSKPNLTSRRSLLTSLMHEGDRATALQNAASQSTPALRRSRNSALNGPMAAASPEPHTLRYEPQQQENQIPRSKPIIMTTSNTHAPPALSPRTTRRNMLTTELTESLRKHLLWERQQKNSTNNAVLKRRHTSNDVKNLKHYPGEPQPAALAPVKETAAAVAKGNNSWTTNGANYFDTGLQEYHERGW